MSDSTKLIETKIAELTNVTRLIQNTLNLIGDVEIKGAYAGPVAEIQAWLTGFKASVDTQIEGFKGSLPKEEPKAVEAEIVS